MSQLKLSLLDDDVQIANEFYTTNHEVGELKDEIIKYREPYHEVKGEWYVVKPTKWKPDAHKMLEWYLELGAQDMYEDWEERAWNCITDETVDKIQKILDKTFDEATTNYWEFDFNKPVKIDVYPKGSI